MKKLFLYATLISLSLGAHAQSWVPSGTGPFKLQDAISKYTRIPTSRDADEEQEPGGAEREGKNYLFDRWAWFWKEHLDSNGYMVSPVKTFNEWEQYKQRKGERLSARTATLTSDWVFQGPDSTVGGYAGLGRINAIAFHPTDRHTFYIGSAGGGTWKTTDNGVTWTALYNSLTNMGVSDIKINPRNGNTVYVCTGDADGQGEYSIGIIKSNDGGRTWENTGLTWLPTDYVFTRSLLINPGDTNILTLATNMGIYKSTDAGATWHNVYAGNFKQLLYNPGDTNIVYATDYESTSSQILRSSDAGNTWTVVTSFTGAERINIAVCPASPGIVKAIAANRTSGLEGIYGSTDSGRTYTELFTNTLCTANLLGYELGLPTTQCNGQGWYDLCIAIDPTNKDKVIIGGVNNYYSTDGGTTWRIVSQWYGGLPGIATVHADKHCLVYNPLVRGALYQGCDGGVYETLDPTSLLWNDLTNGLGITEFYRNAVVNGASFCIGGAQDNGTKMVDGGTTRDLAGGDGMQCRIDYGDPAFQTWYVSYPNGSIDMTSNGGVTYNNISNAIPDTLGGDWVTPYIIHPVSDNVLLVGYGTLYASYDQGSTWSAISPAFHAGYNINNIVVPFTNGRYIYAATDDNTIHFSPDFGATWDSVIAPFSGNISRLAADPKNENILWVTYNGYGTNKVATYNRTTTAWTIVNGTLPDVPVNCIVIDSATSTKYIGTDVAVFYKDTAMTDWALYSTHLPSVIINDLNINYSTNDLWAATYGRGMWKTKKYQDTTVTPVDTTTRLAVIQFANDAITISPNPNNGKFTIRTTGKTLIGMPVTIRLAAADGKTVWQETSSFDASGNIKVNAQMVAKGSYICEISINGIMVSRKLIIY